jgi:hypothetical protein
MQRILLAGSRHIAAAERLLAPVLAAWAKEWCLAGEGESLRIVKVSGKRGAPEAGAVSLLATADEWRKALFGPLLAQLPGDDTAAHIGSCAREALLASLRTTLGAGEGAVAAAHVCLDLEINRVQLQLCVDTLALEPHAGRSPDSRPPVALAARDAGIGPASVEMKVEMPLLKVAMGDFLGLKPGDVIRSEAGLDAPFSIIVGGQKLPVKAALGLQGDRKAVRVEA